MRSRRRFSIEELSPFLFPDVPRDHQAPGIAWPAVFGNANPVEIEVGFGKGLFLTNAAAANPEMNFFGIEIVRKYQLYAATKLAARPLPNVKLACADALVLLRDRVKANSVQAMHVYFPDPWWKKRHHKRRLFTKEFAAVVAAVLQPFGMFHLVTDVKDYHDVMMTIMQGLPLFEAVPAREATDAKDEFDYLTNFERKFRKEGRPIYRSAFCKRAIDPPVI